MSATAATSGPAGSRRFWVTVACFAVANLATWIAYDRLVQRRHPALLEVQQSAPGDQSVVNGRPTFWWTFNLDVAPAKPNDPPPGVVSPSIPGKWVWDNPRTLDFVPDAPLPKATALTLTLLPERLQTREGFRLKKPQVTSVRTDPLQVMAVRQSAFDDQGQVVIEIEFDDDVIPSEALAHLSLRSFEDKPIAFQPHGDATGHVVRVLTSPVPTPRLGHERAFVKVELAPGLSGRSGPLGLAAAYRANLPIDSDLMATDAQSFFDDHGDAVLTLRFNNAVDFNAIKSLLSVEPAVPFTLGGDLRGIELHGPFQPATRYAIKIAPAPAGTPRGQSPRPDTLSVFVPDRAPSVWFEHDEGYLGSAGNRTLLAHAVNIPQLRATLTRIYDNNLVAWRNTHAGTDTLDRPIVTRDIRLSAQKNKTQDVKLSLDDLLPADAPRDGVYLVHLDPAETPQLANGEGYLYYGRWQDSAVVTLSDIGLTAKQGRTAVTVWATSLRTAEPLAHVRVRLYSNKNQFLGEAVTGDTGLASIAPAACAEGEEPTVVLADRPEARADAVPASASASSLRDLTWLDLRTSRFNFGESQTTGAAYLRAGHEAFIYTDRGVYRPGETVHLRAIVRGPDGSTPPAFPVQWQFRRPDLHDWKSVAGRIDPDGAVALDLQLPDNLPTGRWSVTLGLPGHEKDDQPFGSESFQVEDFMPNRMAVSLKFDGDEIPQPQEETPRYQMAQKPLSAKVQADYLFGKPVAERPARLVARLDPAAFSPRQWSNWTFGDSAATAQVLENARVTGHRLELPEEELDANGGAAFDLDLKSLLDGEAPKDASTKTARRSHRPPHSAPQAQVEGPLDGGYAGPWELNVTASVIETGGRAVSASRQAELDAVPWYIGVRQQPTTAPLDAPSRFEIALICPDGKVANDDANLEATLYREDWNNSLSFEEGHYVYHSTRLLNAVMRKTVKMQGGKGTLDVQPPEFGSFVLRVRDGQSGCMTSFGFYAGQGTWEDNVSRENPEKLELLVRPAPGIGPLLDAVRRLDPTGASAAARNILAAPAPAPSSAFRPGDVAQVIVRSPFAGRLLLSVETDDVVRTRVIEMPASHLSVPIQIPQGCRPNAYITATVVRAVDPDAPWQTHRAGGTLRIAVDNSDRKLDVQLAAATQVRPTSSMSVGVRVTDASGAPVRNAAVTVAAVDEGICQLTGFTAPDPFGFFTRTRALGVGTADLYGQLMPEVAKPDKVSAVGGDKDAYDPRHKSPVSARRVKPVSLVSGVLHTNDDGLAQTDFSVPQFTGKLRLMAVASGGPAVGSSEGAVTVRSPLLVQSSWPRFAAPGDKFLVPVVIFNNTPTEADSTLALHISDGPLRFGNGPDASLPPIHLPANGQATRFVEATAVNDSGVSHAELIARMGDESYREDVEIPVRPASPTIELGGYAVATPEKPIEISLPGGMLKGTGQTQIKVTPWPSLALPQGLDYLERYPYGCLEQTTSTLFPLAYLSDIGQQIAPGLFEKDRVAGKIQSGIVSLIGMQTANGGLAMWPAYRDPWPWGSVYAAHFLVEAQAAGHPVPEEFMRQLLSYVRNLLNQSSDEEEVLETQAYACYVLALAGKPERAAMSRLGEIVNSPRADGAILPGQARLHLAAAWLAAGRRDLAESLIPQTLPAPRMGRSLTGALGSPVRDRAILVDTLLAVEPDHPALPDLVQQLADAGSKGQWRSTQDTAFAVLALGHYLRQVKASSPYASAELAFNGSTLGSASDGKPLLWDTTSNNSSASIEGGKLAIRITGAADAKAHVAWLQSGVPITPPPPSDHGMKIRKRLLDERGRPLATNAVHSGDLVQIELTIQSDTPLEHIAIDDLLPAGLEIENPRLLTTAADVAEQPADHQTVNPFQDTRIEMRDDRLVLIGNLNEAGAGRYVYAARAVTPGKFVLPPAHAECMYDLATNSISAGGTFEVAPAGSARIANVQD